MAVEVKFEDVGTGICSLSGKEGEVFEVAFGDGTIKGSLSLKAIAQLLRMKLAKNPRPVRIPEATKVNGTVG